jgi:hypothetical protein
VPNNKINEILEKKNLGKEISDKYLNMENFNLAVKNKTDNLKKYYYENILFNNYGTPILDNLSNEIIGYKINETEYATVKTYFDNNNNQCNEVSIKDFNPEYQTFGSDKFISGLEIKTLKGLIRTFVNVKYYYNNEYKVYIVEKVFNCQAFPSQDKNKFYDNKFGTIDLET